MDDKKTSDPLNFAGFDPLGLKAAAEISKDVVKFGLDGVKVFLNLTCKPLLEELGFGFRDKWSNWRLLNVVSMLEKSQGKLKYDSENEKITIDPRVAFQIAEHASIASNSTLQDMWAGLFASSCQTYEEDENIFYIDILKRLTSSQVKLINHLCQNSKKSINIIDMQTAKENGLIHSAAISMKYEEIMEVMETSHNLKVDTELNALSTMGLIEFQTYNNMQIPISHKVKNGYITGLKSSLISVSLYVKCQGSRDNPFNYFFDQIADYFYQLLKDYVSIDKTEIMDYAFEAAQKGKQFETELTFGAKIKFLNAAWLDLNSEEIADRLKAYIIFQQINRLSANYPVEFGNKDIGIFNFKEGYKAL